MKKDMGLESLSKKLATASDPTRMRILCHLFTDKGICVSELAEELGLSVAIVSHHLQALAKENILLPRRNGKKVCYILSNTAFVANLKEFICKNTQYVRGT